MFYFVYCAYSFRLIAFDHVGAGPGRKRLRAITSVRRNFGAQLPSNLSTIFLSFSTPSSTQIPYSAHDLARLSTVNLFQSDSSHHFKLFGDHNR
jgi:hypothetical protein